MHILTPSQAAAIADGVYGLIDRTLEQAQARHVDIGCEGLFPPLRERAC